MNISEWALESRVRYAAVTGVGNALVFAGIAAIVGPVSVMGFLRLAAIAFVINFVAQGWIWYPRMKRKRAAEEVGRAEPLGD
jgi:membrane protein implicated in regulation of membrane protease activity